MAYEDDEWLASEDDDEWVDSEDDDDTPIDGKLFVSKQAQRIGRVREGLGKG